MNKFHVFLLYLLEFAIFLKFEQKIKKNRNNKFGFDLEVGTARGPSGGSTSRTKSSPKQP